MASCGKSHRAWMEALEERALLSAQYYSNPRITFRGVPIGDADSADAARTITLTAPYVANYMKRPKGR